MYIHIFFSRLLFLNTTQKQSVHGNLQKFIAIYVQSSSHRNIYIFLKILQAVGVGFVHIPDIGPIPFQIIEKKLVQRFETHIEAQSCKAS